MRLYFLIILSISTCTFRGYAQKDRFVVRTEFANQGEQEDYWAEKFFHEKYRKQTYQKYGNEIQVENNMTYKFDSTVIHLFEDSKDLGSIFKLGILFPSLFIYNKTDRDTLEIGSLEELKFLKLPPARKRFRLWFYEKGFVNPTVYLFELTNELASTLTDLKTFIKGASLTFLKHGWVII